jgi:peptide/nickel transport system substrate-binding protein
MVEGAFNGYALPATDTMELSPQRPNVPKCCGKGYDYDLNKAKQFLAEAGWKDTDGDGILDKNGESLKDLKLVVTSDSSQIYQKDLALILQSQLKKVGINIEIQTVELAEYWEEAREGKYDLIILYNGGLPTALSLEVNSFKLEGGYKRSFYENQNGTLKTIADNISTAVNKEARDKDICQLCNILYEEAGVIPLVYEMQYAVMNKKVKGFEQGSDPFKAFLDHVEECWIED